MAAFVAVADLRGFAPAARRLGLGPSAVTRMIAALEERLATRLLQRTTRSVTLTDAGARYLERARRILGDIEEAECAAQAERVEPTGRLLITAPAMFGRLAVAPLLSAYLARYPGVVGELTLSDRIVNLVEEGVDVAVRIGLLSDSTLYARKVGETGRVVVAAPGPTTIPLSPCLVTNSADVAISHAERGGGLAMVLAYQVRDAVRAGRLAVVLTAFEPPPLPIHLVYPTTRLLSAKVRAFVDMVLETCDWRFAPL